MLKEELEREVLGRHKKRTDVFELDRKKVQIELEREGGDRETYSASEKWREKKREKERDREKERKGERDRD